MKTLLGPWISHPLMAADSFGTKCHPATEQKWSRSHLRGRDGGFKMTTRPPDSPDLSRVERLWDLLDKQVRSVEELQELKGSAANSSAPDTRARHRGGGVWWSPGLPGSGLFWQQKDGHDFRRAVVLLCLIGARASERR